MALRWRVVQMNRGKVGKCKHRFLVAYSQVFFSKFFSEGSGSGAAARLCVYIKNRRGALICISLRFYLYFVSTFPQSRRAAVSMAPLGWLSSLNLTGRYLLLFPHPPFPSVCCDEAPRPAQSAPSSPGAGRSLRRGNSRCSSIMSTTRSSAVEIECWQLTARMFLSFSAHSIGAKVETEVHPSRLRVVESVFLCRKRGGGALFCESPISFWSSTEDSEEGLQRQRHFHIRQSEETKAAAAPPSDHSGICSPMSQPENKRRQFPPPHKSPPSFPPFRVQEEGGANGEKTTLSR